tara:strand:+ start:1718 stop:2332 length:615 start_codon:yes stop_codon:yes gene_type:complete
MIKLDTHGYHIERNFISKELLDVMNIYFMMLQEIEGDDAIDGDVEHVPGHVHRDNQVEGSMTKHGDLMTESLLSYLTPKYSKIAGIPLVPTYSFFRYYNTGQVLERHDDRIACEFSATVPIGYSEIWPIWLTDFHGNDVKVDLEIGDILFYKGCAVQHWREAFQGDWAHQTFLHWVDIETAQHHPGLVFDGRRMLGDVKYGPGE